MLRVGRNDPCPCGSGKKYKACCMKAELPVAKKKLKAKMLNETKPTAPVTRTFENTMVRSLETFPHVPPEDIAKLERGEYPTSNS